MKVSVVVLCWNSAKYISKCLNSLKKLRHQNCDMEVVVVDNASTDDSTKLISSKFPSFTLIRNPVNLGYAGGNNIGIAHALGSNPGFIWIVNPDIVLSPDSLMALLKAAENRADAGILTPKIYFSPGFEFHKDRYTKADFGKVIWSAGGFIDWANLIARHRGVNEVDIGQYNSATICDFATGASIFINSKVLDSVGLIDEKYYLYFEENDLCQRARRAGWKILYVPDAVCWHANAQATGIGSPLVDYYTTRNRLLFGWRWAPLRTKFALFRESLRHLSTGRPWQRRGVIDFYLMNFGRGSYSHV